MIWSLISAVVCAVSSVGLSLAVLKLVRDTPERSSSVYWLLIMFSISFLTLSSTRTGYYIWLATVLQHLPAGKEEKRELDMMGIHAITELQHEQTWLVTAIVVVGDTALFGVFLWLSQLTFQLSGLLSHGMDQGEEYERVKIRWMAIIGFLAIAAMLATELVVALCFDSRAQPRHFFLLANYVLQITVVAYMVTVIVCIKIKGRDLDVIDGMRVVAPIYRRLEGIMMTYAVMVTQFHTISLTIFLGYKHTATAMTWLAVSTVVTNTSGLALSVVIGCSQLCVLRACRCLLKSPKGLDAYILADASSNSWWSEMQPTPREEQPNTRLVVARSMSVLSPPGPIGEMEHPVFVYTDIESSSALWAIDDGRIMQEATELHDALIRELVAKLGGYEIATAGDAFHLAFSSVPRAVLFCLTVQLRLMSVRWPRQLYGLVPATRTVRCGLRTVFRGLRVRMGVHCYDEEDGPLLRSIHAVTGTTTYSGVSVAIANTIGDRAAGGQILVTTRVAALLMETHADMCIPFVMDKVPVCHVCLMCLAPSSNTLERGLFQIFPKILARRHKLAVAADIGWGDGIELECCEGGSRHSCQLVERQSEESKR